MEIIIILMIVTIAFYQYINTKNLNEQIKELKQQLFELKIKNDTKEE